MMTTKQQIASMKAAQEAGAFRVHFPLITCDAQRDFATEAQAQSFASERRDAIVASPYMTSLQALRVRVEAL